jgi:tRNA A37 threonylcarbamoyltransferase TsaD
MGAASHLEVHICTRRSDKVVTAPPPTIMLVSGSKTQMVPVAEMEGVGEGLKDFHFGNNVQMIKGRTYTVRVTVGSDHAAFHVTPG